MKGLPFVSLCAENGQGAAVPVWGFHEVGRGAQGASRVAPGKLGFNGRGEGNASLLSSHGRVLGLKTR